MDQDPIPPPPIAPPSFATPPQMSPLSSEPEPELVPLKKLPFPVFVRITMVVTVLAFLVGVVRFPSALSSAVGFERAEKKMASGDAEGAADLLEPIAKSHPNSKEIQLTYGEACLQSERFKEAIDVLQSFEGKEVSKEEDARLNAMESVLSQKAKEVEDLQKQLDAEEKLKKDGKK